MKANGLLRTLYGNYWSLAILALILLVLFPLSMDIFRLNLVGKYLT